MKTAETIEILQSLLGSFQTMDRMMGDMRSELSRLYWMSLQEPIQQDDDFGFDYIEKN